MSKQILGLTRLIQRSKFSRFSDSEKRLIIEDYLQGGVSKSEIWKKYTGREDHGVMLRWMRKFGYISAINEKSRIFAEKNFLMSKKSTPKKIVPDFENLQLQNRILELEKKLKESELKGVAYQTMIDIAEREFNISIKKNFGFKPSKR
jgi:transposase-like protein